MSKRSNVIRMMDIAISVLIFYIFNIYLYKFLCKTLVIIVYRQ